MTVQNKTLQIVLVTENKIVGIVICIEQDNRTRAHLTKRDNNRKNKA